MPTLLPSVLWERLGRIACIPDSPGAGLIIPTLQMGIRSSEILMSRAGQQQD